MLSENPALSIRSGGLSHSYDDGIDREDRNPAKEAAFRTAFISEARRIARDWPIEHAHHTLDIENEEREIRELRLNTKINTMLPDGGWLPGHEIEAARLRGVAHARAYVRAADDQLGWHNPEPIVGFQNLEHWLADIERWDAEHQHDAYPPPEVLASEAMQNAAYASLQAECDRLNSKAAPQAEKPLQRDQPQFAAAADLINYYPTERPSVIDGLLREGETLNMIASPKMGKSWLVTDMGRAVATGQPWLGTFNTRGGDVLILDNELHPTTTASRIPRVAEARGTPLADYGNHLFVDNLRGRLMCINRLGTYFAAIEPGRFKLIVLDAFYRFMPKGTDENDNAGMAAVYNLIDMYAAHLGAAFVLIHHSSKGNQSDKSVTDVGAGAGSQSRAADAHLVLRPHEEDDVVVLDAAVRSWAPIDPLCLRWRFPVYDPDPTLDPSALRRAGGRASGGQARTPQVKPEEFVEQFIFDEPAGRDTILTRATIAGISGKQAERLLKAAADTGLIRNHTKARNKPAKYSIKHK